MKKNSLGRTGLSVTEICLGTMTWGVQNTEADAHEQLDIAVDAGINFIDTAEGYAIPMSAESYGKTETYIGNWFKKSGKRDKVILASKIAGGGRQEWIRGGARPSRASVREAVENSLKRLQTDHIDLYQIHWPMRSHYHFGQGWNFDFTKNDAKSELQHMHDTLLGLDDMVREGKIRHVGLSNETAWGTMRWLRLAEEHGLPRMASIQNEYGLLQRHYDYDMAEVSLAEDIGLLAYSTLAAGVLTGKYLGGNVPAGSRAAVTDGGLWRDNSHSEPVVRAYIDVARKHGLDIAQMGIAFSLTRPFMTSVIIGATTVEQLKTDIAAHELKLSDEVLADIAEVYRNNPRPL
ncbi:MULTISPECIES: aldo/keto reductase [Brucella/Ochrobactrum group]|uniref:Aldo/keto reductase n=1 Tax=Ochrobactrum soli TaxID=2448455 RepID=A0A849KU84_9HYPH|nr:MULTISPECIES: aldo/keto reductase [Brucella]MCI1000561.1 aldo/keto reductase [Ochrobactrum sp. C6C9]RRD24696.1 aldo/keto reductase [Brucellaceae bacterium VT-16-1752]MDX4073692.1 aldo/keto reductase [Brucella sp. NBRC 113783]NNU62369.1 aldo/keto reductase [[Ochrobactrum] soli]RLL74162.1 aldo/keto reductase [[Ochrobactrum] soli]